MTPPTGSTALLEHAAFVRALARSLVADDATADDVVQETWLSALQHPPRAGAVRPWLARVTRNAVRRVRRGDGRRREREEHVARAESLPSTEEQTQRELALRAVVDAVLELPEAQRRVVMLRFYDGLPPREIAVRTGENLATVKSRLKRALQRLRSRLASEGEPCRAGLLGWLALPTGAVSGTSATGATAAAALWTTGAIMSTKALAAAGLLAVAGLWWGLSPRPGGEVSEPPESAAVAEELVELAPAAPPTERSAVAAGAPASAHTIRGRVVDTDGEPVVGVPVWVGAEDDPFGRSQAGSPVAWDAYRGRAFATAADGTYEASLPEVARVLVTCAPAPAWELVDKSERWVQPPASEVDFVVDRFETAELVVRAVDVTAQKALENFQVAVRGEQYYSSRRARGESARFRLRIDPGPLEVAVHLIYPEPPGGLSQEVVLFAGEEREVVLAMYPGDLTQGQVVDQDGLAVADALVFFGLVGPDDEPFEYLDASRISGVRTDAGGWFELPGDGTHVSAWHEKYTGKTVLRESCARIQLSPRGEIFGFLRGYEGDSIHFDELRDIPIQEDGSFHIEDVEAGVHALIYGSQTLQIVRVEPGGRHEVDLAGTLESVTLELRQGAALYSGDVSGMLFSLDGVGSAASVGTTNGIVQLSEVFPGRYLLMAGGGIVAPLTIDGPLAVAEIGSAELTIRADPRTPVILVPEGYDEFVRLLAGRLAGFVPESGELTLDALHPGRYQVATFGSQARQVVDVGAGGATVELD